MNMRPALTMLAIVAGCVPRSPGIVPAAPEARSNGHTPRADGTTRTEGVVGDPLTYLREVARRAASQRQYQAVFVRQERLGLVPNLRPVERINAWFRAEPFSVKFEWQGDASEFREAAFVAGRNQDKVLLLRRTGLLGFPPGIERYDPQDSVKVGKSRNAITDFGFDRMMQRTLNRLAGARRFGGADLRYMGTKTLEGVLAHHFHADYPAEDEFPNKRQDLYVEVAAGLPLGVYLWLPDGQLDAMYLYLDRSVPAAPLTDDVFAIRHVGKKSTKQAALR